MIDRSEDASCLLGLEGLAVERGVLTAVGVKIVQLVTDDPEAGHSHVPWRGSACYPWSGQAPGFM